MNVKLKEWIIGRSPLFIIILIGGGYVLQSKGIATIEVMLITLIGIFAPCLAFVEILRLVLDKALSNKSWMLLGLSVVLSSIVFLTLASLSQTYFLLRMDGVFCSFILLYVLIKRFVVK